MVGPWRHGGHARTDGDVLGNIQFGSKTSVYFRENVEAPFFYYLKGKGDGNFPEATVFLTGTNEWRTYDSWPSKEAKERNLYFHADGKLSFEPPTGKTSEGQGIGLSNGESDSYVSDPWKPVPYTAEIRNTEHHEWMVEDQRFASRHPDVLVYESDVLKEDVTIAGPIIAGLNAATMGTDADFVVKLTDVYPGDPPDPDPNPNNVRMGGFQMMLAGDVIRAKFRNSLSNPEPMKPGEITNIESDLLDKLHTFTKGHRIMVQVQSSWFTVIDVNPNKFMNIFEAKADDYQPATISIYRSPQRPSFIELRALGQ